MKLRPLDTPFLLVVCGLIVFGLLIFTSAALGLLARDGATFTSVAVNQLLLGFLLGGIGLIITSRIDYKLWRPYTPYIFGFAIVLTLLTFVPHIGLELKGASRWLNLGPVSFQPVEFLKLAMVGFLAAVYAGNYRKIDTIVGGVVPLLAIAGGSAFIVLLQPDTASGMMLTLAGAAMFFAAGGRMLHMVLLALIGIVFVAGAAFAYPHVRDRLVIYLDQSQDPHGSGYQITQSLIAVGSGGWTGRGFGQSIEKFSYLPEPIGD